MTKSKENAHFLTFFQPKSHCLAVTLMTLTEKG